MINLSEKKIILTGASGLLGSEISFQLASCGANLLLVDLYKKNLQELATRINSTNVDIFECDLSREEEREELFKKVNSTHKSIDGLINNAGYVGTSNLDGWSVKFSKQSISTWREAIEVNLIAPFHLSQLFTPLLLNSNSANIINIASIYGHLGPDWSIYEGTDMANPAAYSSSKGGLVQLTKWLATTLAPRIRVNAISPGGILRNQPKEFIKKYIKKTPLKRMANEKDIAPAVAFFSSDMASYITGQTLLIDGGWSSW